LTRVVEIGSLVVLAGGTVGGIPDWTALEVVHGDLAVWSSIPTIAGLGGLRQTGSLTFVLTQISDLSVLSSLEIVEGEVELRQNPLEVLGLDALREIGGNLKVVTTLYQWNGLTALESVGRDLIVRGNAVESGEVRAWADDISIGGDITICENAGGFYGEPCPLSE
jgi:hypothetical protein